MQTHLHNTTLYKQTNSRAIARAFRKECELCKIRVSNDWLFTADNDITTLI